MVDTLANIKPLKSMQRYEPMLGSITKIFAKLKRAFVARELSKTGLAQGSDAIIAIVAAAGIYYASTYLKVSLPELIVSAIVFNQIVSVSSRLQRMVQLAGVFESSYVRTTEMIAEAEANREVNTGAVAPDIGKSCRFVNVFFSHGKKAGAVRYQPRNPGRCHHGAERSIGSGQDHDHRSADRFSPAR